MEELTDVDQTLQHSQGNQNKTRSSPPKVLAHNFLNFEQF